jgi:hypothetical protein
VVLCSSVNEQAIAESKTECQVWYGGMALHCVSISGSSKLKVACKQYLFNVSSDEPRIGKC